MANTLRVQVYNSNDAASRYVDTALLTDDGKWAVFGMLQVPDYIMQIDVTDWALKYVNSLGWEFKVAVPVIMS